MMGHFGTAFLRDDIRRYLAKEGHWHTTSIEQIMRVLLELDKPEQIFRLSLQQVIGDLPLSELLQIDQDELFFQLYPGNESMRDDMLLMATQYVKSDTLSIDELLTQTGHTLTEGMMALLGQFVHLLPHESWEIYANLLKLLNDPIFDIQHTVLPETWSLKLQAGEADDALSPTGRIKMSSSLEEHSPHDITGTSEWIHLPEKTLNFQLSAFFVQNEACRSILLRMVYDDIYEQLLDQIAKVSELIASAYEYALKLAELENRRTNSQIVMHGFACIQHWIAAHHQQTFHLAIELSPGHELMKRMGQKGKIHVSFEKIFTPDRFTTYVFSYDAKLDCYHVLAPQGEKLLFRVAPSENKGELIQFALPPKLNAAPEWQLFTQLSSSDTERFLLLVQAMSVVNRRSSLQVYREYAHDQEQLSTQLMQTRTIDQFVTQLNQITTPLRRVPDADKSWHCLPKLWLPMRTSPHSTTILHDPAMGTLTQQAATSSEQTHWQQRLSSN
jgi:hypothetical protein